jgi:Zn-dependent M28 family amino/carboxypeptidase
VEVEGELKNVIATPRGTIDRPLILVGAHYDSVPDTPGADDNASGIAAMLACARALARLDPAPHVGFVAWNGEEDGLLGSIEFVAHRRAQGDMPIAAVHVLEMVGYARHEPGSQRMPVPVPGAPDIGDFIGLLANQRSNHLVELAARQAEAVVPELPVVGLKVYLGLEGWLPVLHRSDHSPFWKAKIPAMLWTDTAEFRNPNYHRPTDTPETLDYTFMRRVTQLIIATVARQARGG